MEKSKRLFVGLGLVASITVLGVIGSTYESIPTLENEVQIEKEYRNFKEEDRATDKLGDPNAKSQLIDSSYLMDGITMSGIESMVLEKLKDNLSDVGHVSLIKEDSMFVLMPTSPGFMDEVLAAASGNIQAKNQWENLIESFERLSLLINDDIPGYSIALVNPENYDNYILLAQSGSIVYNAIDI